MCSTERMVSVILVCFTNWSTSRAFGYSGRPEMGYRTDCDWFERRLGKLWTMLAEFWSRKARIVPSPGSAESRYCTEV